MAASIVVALGIIYPTGLSKIVEQRRNLLVVSFFPTMSQQIVFEIRRTELPIADESWCRDNAFCILNPLAYK